MSPYYVALVAAEIYLGIGVLMVALCMSNEDFRDDLKDSVDEELMYLPMEHRDGGTSGSFMVMLFIALIIKWPGLVIWLWGDIGEDE